MNRIVDRSEQKFYRIDAWHPYRHSVDEVVLGISAAEELSKMWEDDGYEVEISNDY